MKYCKDCRHFSYSKVIGARCEHPIYEHEDRVWGTGNSGSQADACRSTRGKCRPEAVLFEPKRTMRDWFTDMIGRWAK